MGYVTVGSYDDYFQKVLAASKPQLDSTIANINSSAEQQKQSVQGIYDKNINDTNAAYEDSYRENAVQKLINEREVAENMANLGLTNSGLNRTQQTAVQLSYANNKASIDRQKQAQVYSFAQSLAAELANIETTRLSSIADVTNQNSQAAMQSAYELRNADLDYNNSLYKAEIEAAQKAAEKMDTKNKNQHTEYLGILSDISSDNKSKEALMAQIYEYIQGYDADIDFNATDLSGTCTNSQINTMLELMGVSASEWKNYYLRKNGYVPDANGDGVVDARDLVYAKKNGNAALVEYIRNSIK